MKTILFLTIALISGFCAGLILGAVNLVLVEPLLDQAIGIENQNLFDSGEEDNTPEFWIKYDNYRLWQKGGQVIAGSILGISLGALFGIVYALSRSSLPGKTDYAKALVLAGIMWFTIYLIPFLKYPANPPTVGNPETVILRETLYLTFITISGLGAAGFYKLFQKLGKKQFIAIAGYCLFIGIIFVTLPNNPDKITAPPALVENFRIMSAFTVSIYWLSLGLIFGYLWNHFKPHKKITPSFT